MHRVAQPALSHSRTFPKPQKEALYSLAVFTSARPQPLATTCLLSVSRGLSTLDILCRRNHPVCHPRCLASFTRYSVSKAHPVGSTYENLIPFYGRMTLHCVTRLQFCFLFTSWWTFRLSPLFGCCENAVCIITCEFLCIFLSFSCCPWYLCAFRQRVRKGLLPGVMSRIGFMSWERPPGARLWPRG